MLFTLLTLAAIQEPNQLHFESERFVAQDGTLTSISSGEDVPGGQPGSLLADFDFQFSGETPVLAALWRITGKNSAFLQPYLESGWRGIYAEAGDYVQVISHDPATGSGAAVVSLPIGLGFPIEQRFPLLPETNCLIEIAVGLKGGLGLDPDGNPTGALFQGMVQPFVTYPDVWVDVYSPTLGPGGTTLATLYSREALQAQRVYRMALTSLQVASFSPPAALDSPSGQPSPLDWRILVDGSLLVNLPPKKLGFHFEIGARQLGDYQVQVTDEGGTLRGESALASVVVGGSVLNFDQVVDSMGNVMVSNATISMSSKTSEMETIENTLDTNPIFRKCIEAQCGVFATPGFLTRCGECSQRPDIPDECDKKKNAYFFTPADCPYSIWYTGCISVGYRMFECPYYEVFMGPTEKDCFTFDSFIKFGSDYGVSFSFTPTRWCCVLRKTDRTKKLQAKQCKDV
ncbi:MAG TPA: hypothetical protein EYG30_12535 [Planctomycetes bacterium]|nr:hypothetical protein [Planctomycetota bacterium]